MTGDDGIFTRILAVTNGTDVALQRSRPRWPLATTELCPDSRTMPQHVATAAQMDRRGLRPTSSGWHGSCWALPLPCYGRWCGAEVKVVGPCGRGHCCRANLNAASSSWVSGAATNSPKM